MNEQRFLQLLESLLQPDTERVKSATSTLNRDYYKFPAALVTLLSILTSHQSSQIRQLAAVEARKLAPKHWASVPADSKPAIRNRLLQTTLNEEGNLVRHSAARVIAAIAKLDLEDGEWTDLPGFLHQAATSQPAAHREVGVYIIYTLLETMGDMFTENASQLFQLFTKTIQDRESAAVRINTMLALSKVAMSLDTEDDQQALSHFQDTVPSMVQVLKVAIDDGDEDNAMQAFEVFQTLLGCDAALLAKHFKDLVQFMIDLAANTDLDDEARCQALAFLMQCVKYRKLKVQGLRFGEQLTLKSLHIVTELDDDSTDEEDVTPARSALGLLDTLASSLPPSQVLVPLLSALPKYCSSHDPTHRRAGLLSLGMCVEGAPDFVASQLKSIFPGLMSLLQDQEASVRSAALNCVARLADDLAEDMGNEHARLIPALIANYDLAINNLQQGQDSEQSLQMIKASCNAIDSLVEGMGEDVIAPYVQELVPRLSRLVDHPDHKVKCGAVGALGSIAAAARDAFAPYFEGTTRGLGQYIGIKDSNDDLELRGVVCDALGNIATAVGAQPFEPYVRPLMAASEEALHLDSPRLKETSYILWGVMAKVYGEEFAPYLDGVVKGLHECLRQEESDVEVQLGEEAKDLIGQEITIAGKKIKVVDPGDEGEVDIGISEGDNDDEDDWDDIGAVTAVAMEKEIAVEVVGEVLTHTKRKFIPYLQKTIEIILGLVEHSYDGVRKSSISTLWRAYACVWSMAEDEGMPKWKPGLPLQIQPPEDLKKLGSLIMTGTLAVWQDEMDRGTVTDINRNLAATLQLCGPAMLIGENGPVIEQITNQLIQVMTKQHPCQQDLGAEADDGEEQLDETSEYDWLVIDTALDTVYGLAKALGPQFVELWKIFEKPIMKYASSSESAERNSATGTIAECIANMGNAVTPFTTPLLKLLLHRLGDEDPEVRSNTAYAIGRLVEASSNTAEITKAYPTILGKLEPILHDKQEARLLDNSAGCVARMVNRHREAFPVAEVLPRLVELLPLKEDYEENEPVYRMIVMLYQQGDRTVQVLTPALIPVLQSVLGPPEEQLGAESRAQVTELVQYLTR